MTKRKKFTEKEWKRQLEEKATFEASEKETKKAAVYAALRSAQIGAKIVETSAPDYPEIIIEIDSEDEEPEYFSFWTNYGNCYEGFDFLDNEQTGEFASVIFVSETEQEQDENQITFDDLAAMTSASETAEPSTVSPSAEKFAIIGGKAGGASPDLGTVCTMSAPVRPAPNRLKTARWRLWWGVGVPPNGFEKLHGGVVVAVWWCGCEKNCAWRGVARREVARAAPA